MNLLFIQGGSRWKFDDCGNVYTDANFNDSIWKRYEKLCDKLTVLLRREQKIYSESVAVSRFNKFNDKINNYIAVPDIYRPVKKNIKFKKKTASFERDREGSQKRG